MMVSSGINWRIRGRVMMMVVSVTSAAIVNKANVLVFAKARFVDVNAGTMTNVEGKSWQCRTQDKHRERRDGKR